MKTKSPLFIAANKLADKIRCGDDSVETRQAFNKAQAAYEADRPAQPKSTGSAWYHSPLLEWAWNGDAKTMKA